MENIKNIPVYKLDSASAAMCSQEDLFARSLAANIECSRFLEDAVESSPLSELRLPDYGNYPYYNDVLDLAIEKFGASRVKYVIANAIRRRMCDGCIEWQYKDWARKVCPIKAVLNDNKLFSLSSLHSCYINGLAINATEISG